MQSPQLDALVAEATPLPNECKVNVDCHQDVQQSLLMLLIMWVVSDRCDRCRCASVNAFPNYTPMALSESPLIQPLSSTGVPRVPSVKERQLEDGATRHAMQERVTCSPNIQGPFSRHIVLSHLRPAAPLHCRTFHFAVGCLMLSMI